MHLFCFFILPLPSEHKCEVLYLECGGMFLTFDDQNLGTLPFITPPSLIPWLTRILSSTRQVGTTKTINTKDRHHPRREGGDSLDVAAAIPDVAVMKKR